VNLATARVDAGLAVTLSGRFGAADTGSVGAALDRLTRDERSIVLDLQGLDYISSAGIGVLEALAERLRGRGSTVEIDNVQPAVRAVLDMAGSAL
jgi:anti-anti-sigma factor